MGWLVGLGWVRLNYGYAGVCGGAPPQLIEYDRKKKKKKKVNDNKATTYILRTYMVTIQKVQKYICT